MGCYFSRCGSESDASTDGKVSGAMGNIARGRHTAPALGGGNRMLSRIARDIQSVNADNTHGIVRFTLCNAVLSRTPSKQVHATVSVGLQTFLSSTRPASSMNWNQGHNFVLQKGGNATVAQVSLYSAGNFKSKLLGYTTIDLKAYFQSSVGQPRVLLEQEIPLLDPISSSKQVGSVNIKVEATTIDYLEQTLWTRLMQLVDDNGDGTLQKEEFETLMKSLGNAFATDELDNMFSKADEDKNGAVSETELAKYVTQVRQTSGIRFLKQCPVTGADLTDGDDYTNIIYVHLAMDEGTGQSLQGGYTTAEQATRSWMLKLSEWATHPIGGSISQLYSGNKYEAGGLNVGTRASHILVWDREKGIVVEEIISPHLVLAMRNLYQSPFGRGMMATGAPQKALKELSESKGQYMDSPESVADIPNFLNSFAGNINVDEAAEPIENYKTFNQFFYRKLKPGSRPLAASEDAAVMVSAADCRLMVFQTVSDATRLWIKGKHFSVQGLLGDETGSMATKFDGGSLVLFRLAPQDYHRFHFPVSGTLLSCTPIPGHLYTVNPIAVNATDIFTVNKRVVCLIDSPQFGHVAFVCIGATMVGSIVITAPTGEFFNKGDEMGYFAFGGSTNVAVFQKDRVTYDQDLLENSNRSLETLVKMGARLGAASSSASPQGATDSAELDNRA